MRGTLALAALLALASSARAELVLDDFTEDGFTHRLTQRHSFLWEQSGLDRAHSAWGFRGSATQINSNPQGRELEIHVGGGEQAFRTDGPIAWFHQLRLGNRETEVDLSGQTRINVDYFTQWPPNMFADNWDILVADADFRTASNGGWYLRPEGIYFEISEFSRPVDWSRITLIQFTQNWDSFPNPLTYAVTRIYAVPEPSALLAVGAGLAALRKWRAAKRR